MSLEKIGSNMDERIAKAMAEDGKLAKPVAPPDICMIEYQMAPRYPIVVHQTGQEKRRQRRETERKIKKKKRGK